MVRTLLGLGAMAAIFVGILGMNDAVGMFFDTLSLVFVVGLTIAGTVASFPPNRLSEALVPGQATTPEAMARRAVVLHRMADLSVSAGIAGTIVGLVLMLRNMDDPSQIGPAMAVALLTLLYGVVLGEMVLRGMASHVPASSDDAAPAMNRRGSVSIYLPLLGLFCLLTTFFTMLLAML